MNFSKAFTYIFDDPKWFEKLIVPMLVSLIPVVGPMALAGYIMRTTRNVAEGVAYPLPEFDFGMDLGRGFRWLVITLVYSIPLILLSLLWVIPLVRVGNGDAGTGSWIMLFIFGGLFLLVALVISLVIPLAQVNFAVKDTFASAFDFKAIYRMLQNNFVDWLIVLAGVIIGGFISPIGSILLFVGAIITGTYSQLMVAHLAGQAYNLSQAPRA